MTVPVENHAAFFPPSVTVGKVAFHPITLSDAVRLADCGVDLTRTVPREKVVEAAAILAGLSVRSFARRYKGGLNELSQAVEMAINTGFSTFIRPRSENGKGMVRHLTPHGLGWPLECAEFLCSEYGWSWRDAVAMPLVTVFALVAACRERSGGKHGGLDYMERQYCADLKAGKIKPIILDSRKEEAALGID